MPVIRDDYHAVEAADVSAVVKPDQEWMHYLTLSMNSGATVELRFDDTGQRDDFYKSLIDGMEKAS